MTIEEEDAENVIAQNSIEFFVNKSESDIGLPRNKFTMNISKEDSVRSKMEAMQKRIDELKEKVKYEGELLYKKEFGLGQDILDIKSIDSLSDAKSKDSLSQDSKSFEDKISENEEHSDKSLYFSASSYSMCSMSSNSSDSTYCSFTKFVNNYMKNQDHKERLSLLQLHSKKQISLNMLKTSLLELESRCSEELELVEKSLKHLNKLAEEFKVDNEQHEENLYSYKMKALNFNGRGDCGLWRPIAKASLKCLPLREGSKSSFEFGKEPAFMKHKLKDA